MRWTEILAAKDVCEALTDWLQAEHPRRTMPKVIRVTESLVDGTYTIETDRPLPDDGIEYRIGDDDE